MDLRPDKPAELRREERRRRQLAHLRKGGGRPKIGGRRRGAKLSILVTEQEMERIRRYAEKKNLTVSSFCRIVILHRIQKLHEKVSDAQVVKDVETRREEGPQLESGESEREADEAAPEREGPRLPLEG